MLVMSFPITSNICLNMLQTYSADGRSGQWGCRAPGRNLHGHPKLSMEGVEEKQVLDGLKSFTRAPASAMKFQFHVAAV